jgi:hypothetical protein
MLYNIEKKEIKTDEMCIKCQYYDSKLLKCNGLNKCCFASNKIYSESDSATWLYFTF